MRTVGAIPALAVADREFVQTRRLDRLELSIAAMLAAGGGCGLQTRAQSFQAGSAPSR